MARLRRRVAPQGPMTFCALRLRKPNGTIRPLTLPVASSCSPNQQILGRLASGGACAPHRLFARTSSPEPCLGAWIRTSGAPSIDGSRPRGQSREFEARFDTRDALPGTLSLASDTHSPVKRMRGRRVLLRTSPRREALRARRRYFHRLLQLTSFTSTRNSLNSRARGFRRASSPPGLSACRDRRSRLAARSARVPLRLTPREELRSLRSYPLGVGDSPPRRGVVDHVRS